MREPRSRLSLRAKVTAFFGFPVDGVSHARTRQGAAPTRFAICFRIHDCRRARHRLADGCCDYLDLLLISWARPAKAIHSALEQRCGRTRLGQDLEQIEFSESRAATGRYYDEVAVACGPHGHARDQRMSLRLHLRVSNCQRAFNFLYRCHDYGQHIWDRRAGRCNTPLNRLAAEWSPWLSAASSPFDCARSVGS